MAAKVGRPPRPSPGQQYSQLSHFLANPEQQSVTEVIDLKFVGGLWERQIHCGLLAACSTVQQLRAMQLSRNIIDVYYVLLSFFPRAAQGCPSYHPPPTLWTFSAWCKTISITSHIFYPQLNTFAHFLHRMCHFRGVQCVAVKVGWWPSGPVRRPTSLPSCPQLRPAATATAHSWASQPHCGNPPEAALFPAKSSWLYHFHLSKQRSIQIRRS